MATQMTEEEIYNKARKRVEEKKSFYSHLAVYLVINIVFVIIWAVTSPGGYGWFIWPLGGWGAAVILHFLSTFVFNIGARWEKHAIEKEAEKLRKNGKSDKQ
jgi:nitrate reductase NapE component